MKAGRSKASAIGAPVWPWLLAFTVLLGLVCGLRAAQAETRTHHLESRHRIYASRRHHEYAARTTHEHHYASYSHRSRVRLAHYEVYRHERGRRYASARYRYSRLQCVPYAREVSHIQLSGDAFLWWAEAAGRYARGTAPVEGAVLNFRSIRRMPLGHVAVVTGVIDSRTILVTQANWIRGTITNDVTMEDVSPNNDWSDVEVELGDSSRWGAAYPTYGFIYNQPASSTVIASTTQGDEVAEAPRPAAIQTEAPDRNLQ